MVSKRTTFAIRGSLRIFISIFYCLKENRRNDPAFLRATATGWRKDKLKILAKNDWLKFEGGGGIGEILKYAEEILGQPDKYLRNFLLFDSDALKPNEPSKQSQEVVAVCHLIIPCHQLKRRAIENYLPYETLSIWMGMDVHKNNG
jgi:hypothetical protein